ncbi:hypothetical protein [Marimonas lutisalis]|uniref:hypothetical protein n=1 Tax=Marimonas lutisalis TaxID=2545756 RepID=UPI0010F74401|nr:hypothetical protein [Marimonas lutisalis]
MRRRLRPILGLVLALMLALTGQSMAVARGMPDAAGQIVLCTGAGPISVMVDDEGNPVGPSHICPDCALSLFAMDVSLPLVPARPLGKGVRLRPDGAYGTVSFDVPGARARGPPVRA